MSYRKHFLKEIFEGGKRKCEFLRWKGNHNSTINLEDIQWNTTIKFKEFIKSPLYLLLTIRKIFCYFIALRGSINTLHTTSGTHLLKVVKGVGHVYISVGGG